MKLIALAILLGGCTVNRYYAAPPAPPSAPAPATSSSSGEVAALPASSPSGEVAALPASSSSGAVASSGGEAAAPLRAFVELGIPGQRLTAEEIASADAELGRRFAVAKAYLIARRGTHDIYSSMLGRVGRPAEQAPIVEVPGGGFLIALDRHTGELERRPVLVRIDATGRTLWSLDLPTAPRYATYETNGIVLAPDGTAIVEVCPYDRRHNPRASLLAKVDLDGRLVWKLQLPETKAALGPYPQDVRVDATGTIRLTGHITLRREAARAPGTGDYTRHWTGTVTAAGAFAGGAIGGLFADDPPMTEHSPHRRVFPFWGDL